MARRSEVRYRLTAKQIASLAAGQADVLARAAGMVKVGGRICYSTCSIDSTENEDVVGGFLKGNAGFELLGEKLTLPSAARVDRDGGHAAVLRRI